eukprot:TRINITY_DN5311_c0_g1_i1.p1 TRINITY_DN5311_c0_g1~~TRINITY_DN5311_c0_g1_i1.p1  ORF type:complete len:472 (-),score=56.17 TRINITY_DN5311_c0_g1_i1:18-1433(-)
MLLGRRALRIVLGPPKQMMSSVTKNPKQEYVKKMYRITRNNRLYPMPPSHIEESPYIESQRSNNPLSRVYVWGLSSYGALGIPEYLMPMKNSLTRYKKTGYFKPVLSRHHPVRCSRAESLLVVDVSAGFGFTLFVTKDKEKQVLGTGLNKDGQIGHHLNKEGKAMEVLVQPTRLELPHDAKISRVSCGRAHSLILSRDGTVFSLGNNAYGQCGRPIILEEDYSANKGIHALRRETSFGGDVIRHIYTGQDHSLFLSEEGRLYSCGWSADGQTGLEHYNNQESVALVQGDIKGERIVKVACAADCVLALNDRGEVFGWGNGEYGQFHSVTEEQQLNRPTSLPICNQLGRIVDIASGGSTCYILNDQNELYTWGFGILGSQGNTEYSTKPLKLSPCLFGRSEWEPDITPARVFCGIGTNAVVNSRGDLYVWGKNRNGCLGIGSKEDAFKPTQVYLEKELKDLSLGVDHSVALC